MKQILTLTIGLAVSFLGISFSGLDFLGNNRAFAVSEQKDEQDVNRFDDSSTMTRVGGNYLVKEIKRTKKGSLLVTFESVVKNGKADFIRLDSDHIHVGVEEGQTLRISAEISKGAGKIVDANQILLFLPRAEGPVPVWLLSKKGRKGSLRGSSYLKMHDPKSDYVIM